VHLQFSRVMKKGSGAVIPSPANLNGGERNLLLLAAPENKADSSPATAGSEMTSSHLFQQRFRKLLVWAGIALAFGFPASRLGAEVNAPVFNVKDFGATGKKSDNAQPAIQKAIDAAARAGGGTVYFPPGEFTSGTLHIGSHVRVFIDAGATLFASQDPAAYDKSALFYGADVENISLEGRGTVNGQAEYVWRMNDLDDAYIRDNQRMMESLGKPLMRSFPKGFPTRTVYPHLVMLLHAKDVRISGLSFLDSPSWTIYPYACERLTIDGVHIHSSQKMGVWADGIDPDGCKDVIISNSVIETGDDAIVFYSSNISGPPLPCENITITNCRLSSSSSALKFCDGNMNAIRNVTVDNCVITGSNRGIAFMVYDGGTVTDVVLSNLIVNCDRFDWFWWGNGDPIYFTIQRRSESQGLPPKPGEPPAGRIRNVLIRNVIAHGKGSCLIMGHPTSPLENVRLENIQLFLSTDPAAAYDRSVHAMYFRYARDLELKDVEVIWQKPESSQWQSALYFQDVQRLELDDFAGAPAKADFPAVVLDQVEGATITNSHAKTGTQVFLRVSGSKSRAIDLVGNDLGQAHSAYQVGPNVKPGTVKASANF
jgi:glycosyl hydrolase family 28/pectate lyase-like protein